MTTLEIILLITLVACSAAFIYVLTTKHNKLKFFPNKRTVYHSFGVTGQRYDELEKLSIDILKEAVLKRENFQRADMYKQVWEHPNLTNEEKILVLADLCSRIAFILVPLHALEMQKMKYSMDIYDTLTEEDKVQIKEEFGVDFLTEGPRKSSRKLRFDVTGRSPEEVAKMITDEVMKGFAEDEGEAQGEEEPTPKPKPKPDDGEERMISNFQ